MPRSLIIKGDTDEAEADRKITADNLRYFGNPVYEYTMSQGVEDGYLAACEIQRGHVNIDDTGLTYEEVMEHKHRLFHSHNRQSAVHKDGVAEGREVFLTQSINLTLPTRYIILMIGFMYGRTHRGAY
jgi:type I site-specific restriction endonuclease